MLWFCSGAVRSRQEVRSWISAAPPSVVAEQSQDGWSWGQARGTTVHQWSGRKGQRSCAGLLPHVCVCAVRSDSRHPRPDGTVWLHFLFPLLISSLSAAHSQGRTAVEQILQIAAAALHRRPRWRSFHLRPLLDFLVWDGARVLKHVLKITQKYFYLMLCNH